MKLGATLSLGPTASQLSYFFEKSKKPLKIEGRKMLINHAIKFKIRHDANPHERGKMKTKVIRQMTYQLNSKDRDPARQLPFYLSVKAATCVKKQVRYMQSLAHYISAFK